MKIKYELIKEEKNCEARLGKIKKTTYHIALLLHIFFIIL